MVEPHTHTHTFICMHIWWSLRFVLPIWNDVAVEFRLILSHSLCFSTIEIKLHLLALSLLPNCQSVKNCKQLDSYSILKLRSSSKRVNSAYSFSTAATFIYVLCALCKCVRETLCECVYCSRQKQTFVLYNTCSVCFVFSTLFVRSLYLGLPQSLPCSFTLSISHSVRLSHWLQFSPRSLHFHRKMVLCYHFHCNGNLHSDIYWLDSSALMYVNICLDFIYNFFLSLSLCFFSFISFTFLFDICVVVRCSGGRCCCSSVFFFLQVSHTESVLYGQQWQDIVIVWLLVIVLIFGIISIDKLNWILYYYYCCCCYLFNFLFPYYSRFLVLVFFFVILLMQ